MMTERCRCPCRHIEATVGLAMRPRRPRHGSASEASADAGSGGGRQGRPFGLVRWGVEDVADPTGASKNVFPAFWKDGDELNKPMRDSRNESDFNVVLLIEFSGGFFEANLLTFLKKVELGHTQAASKDDGIVNQRIPFTGQEIGLWEFGEQIFWRDGGT